MATDLERLAISLEANLKRYEREMARSRQVTNAALDKVEREVASRGNAISNAFGGLARRATVALGAIGAGLSLNELRKTADEYKKILNTLSVAGVSEAQRGNVLDALTRSAQANAAPLDALATLYGRVAQAQTTLNTSSGEMLRFTDLVAQSLRVSGTSATEASGALLQLGQAMAGGRVQAEEYNSLLDGAQPLLQAVAAGMREAGGDVAKLTSLVKDGKVSSEAFYRAGLAGAQVLKDKLAGAVTTTEQATQRLKTEFTLAVGKFDEAVGLTPTLVKGLDSVAGSMAGIGSAATSAVTGVQSLLDKIVSLYEANGAVQRQQGLNYRAEKAARVGEARDMGTANAGGRGAVAAERAAADRAAADAARVTFRASEAAFAGEQAKAQAAAKATAPKAVPGAISLDDYKVPGSKSGGGSGGSGSSSKEKLDAYERELIQIDKRTKALQLEAAMVGKSTFERERARASLELETAAKKANIPVTDEMRRKIEESATGYANAKVKVEEITKALDAAQDAQRFFGDAITDSLSDMIFNGAKAQDTMKKLAVEIAKAALQASLMGSGPLAGLFGTAGTNGNVGGLIGGLLGGLKLAGGGHVSGPGTGRSDSIPAMLSNGEYVINARATRRNRELLDAINSGRVGAFADGGPVGVVTVEAMEIWT